MNADDYESRQGASSAPCSGELMVQKEIDTVRALLTAKPRPVGWAERRERLDEIGSVWPVADDVRLTALDLSGVPGEWSIVPGSTDRCVLIFFHGGGYCSGSILSHRRMVTEAGRAAGVRTLAVGYRLAPEHPFPAALDDALTAWRFVRKQDIAADHIAVGGDSAGAGLSIALINTLRDAGEAPPACTWLVSPWTDLTMSGSTLTTKNTIDPIIHMDYLEELADAYLASGMNRKDPRVSPLYADLSGFPPTLIQVGSAETLLADSTRFAAMLGAADVSVTLEIWPHMIHAWHLWNAHLEPGRRALASVGAFIRGHL
jgi:monoterpene epsilon-lactone hydrolase